MEKKRKVSSTLFLTEEERRLTDIWSTYLLNKEMLCLVERVCTRWKDLSQHGFGWTNLYLDHLYYQRCHGIEAIFDSWRHVAGLLGQRIRGNHPLLHSSILHLRFPIGQIVNVSGKIRCIDLIELLMDLPHLKVLKVEITNWDAPHELLKRHLHEISTLLQKSTLKELSFIVKTDLSEREDQYEGEEKRDKEALLHIPPLPTITHLTLIIHDSAFPLISFRLGSLVEKLSVSSHIQYVHKTEKKCSSLKHLKIFCLISHRPPMFENLLVPSLHSLAFSGFTSPTTPVELGLVATRSFPNLNVLEIGDCSLSRPIPGFWNSVRSINHLKWGFLPAQQDLNVYTWLQEMKCLTNLQTFQFSPQSFHKICHAPLRAAFCSCWIEFLPHTLTITTSKSEPRSMAQFQQHLLTFMYPKCI